MLSNILPLFRDFALGDPEVRGLLVFGSVARSEATARSDLDLAFVVRSGTRQAVTQRLGAALRTRFPIQFEAPNTSAPNRLKLVLFTSGLCSRVEAFVVEEEREVSRYIVGSQIADPASAVLVDKDGTLRPWVTTLKPEPDDLESHFAPLLRRFQIAFEQGSSCHAASDAIRAHRQFEGAFNELVALAWLAIGRRGFTFGPRQLLNSNLPEDLRKLFAEFENPIDCTRLHTTKVRLIALLRRVLTEAGREERSAIEFCEKVLARDRFWNHEDAAEWVDAGLTPGILFRGASPSHFNGNAEYGEWIRIRGIGLRIDLRSAHERSLHPVVGLQLEVLQLPIDPSADLAVDDVLREGAEGLEPSYRFMAFRCGATLRRIVETLIAAERPVLIHCMAGRDRTGVMVALLQTLVGVPRDHVLWGYSRHSNSTDTQILARVLALVDREGGPLGLAVRADIGPDLLTALEEKLRRPE